MSTVYVNDVDLSDVGFRVRAVAGHQNIPTATRELLTAPGAAGTLVSPVTTVAARDLAIEGFFTGADRDDLLSLLDGGLLQIRFSDQPNRVLYGYVPSGDVAHLEDAFALSTTFPRRLVVRVTCPVPYYYDRYPQVIGFGQARTPVPLGRRPSPGIVRIWGAYGTQIVLRAGTGAEIATLEYDDQIGDGEHLRINLWLRTAHIVDGSGETSVLDDISGSFAAFRLDPRYGDVTIETTDGFGTLEYWRTWP